MFSKPATFESGRQIVTERISEDTELRRLPRLLAAQSSYPNPILRLPTDVDVVGVMTWKFPFRPESVNGPPVTGKTNF
jgi:hypothetical protein